MMHNLMVNLALAVAAALSVLVGNADPVLASLLGFALTMQYSVAVRTAKQGAIETEIGTAPLIEFRTGAPPADCATAASGTLLATGTLPSDWLAAAAAGAVAKTGTWTATGVAAGDIGYFRIYRAGSPSACDMQGTVGPTGSPTVDMTVDNTSVAVSQVITVVTFALTTGNA